LLVARKRGLGRGLDALLPSGHVGPESPDSGPREIRINDILPNRLQPRQEFDPERLAELAESIRRHGVVQPVVVRPAAGGYELIVGERRWRAARQAGLEAIPAVVKDVDSDVDVLAVALVENLQREDLNPLEEAGAYRYLVEEFGLTQEEVAQRVGRSRSQVANTLRLLGLDAEVQAEIQAGNLSMGHAKVILSLPDRPAQKRLYREIVSKRLTVREAEEAAKRLTSPLPGRAPSKRSPAAPYPDVEERLRNALGTRVSIKGKPARGRVEIDYYSREDLQRLVDLLLGPAN